jgi:hypothetical protein
MRRGKGGATAPLTRPGAWRKAAQHGLDRPRRREAIRRALGRRFREGRPRGADQTLQAALEGYRAYTYRVPAKLIPHVW